jgi:effector-binding domain-containing protein
MTTVKTQGIGPVGPWFTHHLKMDPATFDFEICVPLCSSVTPVGRVKPGVWPATKVARAVYHGPFEKLGAAWNEFDTWLKVNGHAPRADLYGCYVAVSESSPDPANWRTELNRPLID